MNRKNRNPGGWPFFGQSRPSFALPTVVGQESVWDYPRPPSCAPDEREVIVKQKGHLIAKTRQAIRVLETASPPTFYLPSSAVRHDWLKRSSGDSSCEWKGQARYWSLTLPDRSNVSSVAWSYDDPSDDFEVIKSYLSFYPSLVECFVDGERVQPQPGGFYGGWVTSEVIGPFKGEPGDGRLVNNIATQGSLDS